MIVNFIVGFVIWGLYFYLLYYLTKQPTVDVKLIRFVILTGWAFMIVRLVVTYLLK